MEKRRNTRVNFKTNVVLKSDDFTIKAEANSDDLSLKGLHVQTAEDVPMDTLCDVELHLTGTTEDVTLNMKGKVVRKDDSGIGVKFESIDIDSFTHLKNILMYNTEDPEALGDELY